MDEIRERAPTPGVDQAASRGRMVVELKPGRNTTLPVVPIVANVGSIRRLGKIGLTQVLGRADKTVSPEARGNGFGVRSRLRRQKPVCGETGEEGSEGMKMSRAWGRSAALALLLLGMGLPRASGQAPTIEESGIMLKGASLSTPGSMSSLLGPMPGSSGITFGMQPGRDDMILGKVGLGAPRVPTSITTPGGVYQGPQRSGGITVPKPVRVHRPCGMAPWSCPRKKIKGRRTD